MTPLLSMNRCGFDINAVELRQAIDDLTRVAGDLGQAISLLSAQSGNPDADRCLASMRMHRGWLMAQVQLLTEKMEASRARRSAMAIPITVINRNRVLS